MRERQRDLALALGIALSVGCGLDAAGSAAFSPDGGNGQGPDGGSPVDGSSGADVTDDPPVGLDVSDSSSNGTSDGGVDAPLADASADGPATTCDPGCGVQSACAGGICTAARRVFVTSEAYDGTLAGGPSNADIQCTNDANNAALGGTWKAWVSTSQSDVAQRFTPPPAGVGYYLVDGTLIAPDWNGLLSGTLQHAIGEDDQGNSVGTQDVWTGTAKDGTFESPDCNDWTTSQSNTTGVGGNTAATDQTWTNATTISCNRGRPIFCFEQ